MNLARRIFVADSYFDGDRFHADGPFTFLIRGGVVDAVLAGDCSGERAALPEDFRSADVAVERAAFLMPGLVEAHCHLFLDGGELDPAARAAYLDGSADAMMAVARRNLESHLGAGVTLVCDAGDRFGINHRIRAEAEVAEGVRPTVRSVGVALRKPRGYGAFLAREIESGEEIVAAIQELLAASDDLKLMLTDIIDFSSGAMRRGPQFTLDEARLVVRTVHAMGRRVLAHCSGTEGLRIAAEAGVDSIEHGYFMTPDVLAILADKGIAWVPTLSPVHVQWEQREACNWDAAALSNLTRILESHRESIARAADLGVAVLAGSDAGSQGVRHGEALVCEILLLLSRFHRAQRIALCRP